MENPVNARRGIILVIVLFLVIILAVVIYQFQASSAVEKRIALTRVHLLQASYRARSTVAVAEALLEKNPAIFFARNAGEGVPAGEDGSPPLSPLPPGVKITDASAMLNVNSLVTRRGGVDRAVKRVLENILTSLGADPAVADAIADFIDPDSKGNHEVPGALNRPLQNVTELGLVPAVPPALLSAGRADGRPGLFDLLTVFSDGRININTAPREIIEAVMGEAADPKVIARILDRRAKKPFSSLGEVYAETGARRGIFGDFTARMTTRPSAYIVDVDSPEENVTVHVRAVFRRRGKRLALVFYREE